MTDRNHFDHGDDDHGISLDLLQQRLHHRLETTGILDRLRAQLRKQILSELRDAGARSCDDQTKQYSSIDRALNAIVADFLRRHEHLYALSVFLSESSTDPELFKANDLERLLNLPEQCIELNTSSKSILAILAELAARFNRDSLKSCAIQTENPDDALESSLRLIDQKFKRLSSEEEEATERSFEERISKQIREVEERAAETLKQEIERIRTTEIAAARISENETYQQELDAIRQRFENQYQERVEQLRAQEQEQNRLLDKRKQTLESLEYERRQQLLAEIETIRLRDIDLKRGVELEKRALQLERESLQKELEDAKRRADVFEKELERKAFTMELRSAEYDSSHRYVLEQDKIQLEHVIKDYNEKRKWLEQETEAYQKCKRDLAEAYSQLKLNEIQLQELPVLKTKINEINLRVGELQNELSDVSEAKKMLEVKLKQSIEEIEISQSRLKALELQLQDERHEYEKSLARIKSEHNKSLQVYKSESSKQQKALQNQILTLSKELTDRFDEDERIQMRYEEEQLRSKSLCREVAGLKNHIDELHEHSRANLATRTTEMTRTQHLGYYLQQTMDSFPKNRRSYLEFKAQNRIQDSVNKETISIAERPKETSTLNYGDIQKNERRQEENVDSAIAIAGTSSPTKQGNNNLVQEDSANDNQLPQQGKADKDTNLQVKEKSDLQVDNFPSNSQDNSTTNLSHYLLKANGDSVDDTSKDTSCLEEPNNNFSNHATDLSSYVTAITDDMMIIDIKSQATEQIPKEEPLDIPEVAKNDITNEFADSKETESKEAKPVSEANSEKTKEDLQRREAIEKKREEMILRAAQQRKEKDERERRERLSNRRQQLSSGLNSPPVNRIPPVRRNFNIDDKI